MSEVHKNINSESANACMHVQILHPCQSAESYSVSLESLGISHRKSKPRLLKVLAQLRRRLIGELIVRPSSTIPNIYFKTAWQIKVKFYVEPPCVEGTKVCSRYPGHMTKMATRPYISRMMRKPTFCICEKQRRRSASR